MGIQLNYRKCAIWGLAALDIHDKYQLQMFPCTEGPGQGYPVDFHTSTVHTGTVWSAATSSN